MKSKILGWLAVGLLAGPMAALAAPINWYLENVAFNDGGTASGSFAFDASTGAFSNMAVTTTGGSILSGTSYSADYAGNSTFFYSFDILPRQDGISTGFFFSLTSAMTNAGGTLDIILTFGSAVEGLCSTGCISANPFRTVTSGYITTTPRSSVPEPGTLALLGLGLLGLGVTRRRKLN